MIVVTGGTGRGGRQVVSQLAELGQPVRVVSRGVTHPETVTSTVRDVTGAPAHSFADWAVANAGAFR